MCLLLAIYACVCKHLGEPLAFPGDRFAWQVPTDHSSAMLNAYFAEWAMLSENAQNERFNCVDDSEWTYETFWPRLAGWYGIPWTGPCEDGLTVVEWGIRPPPRGYVRLTPGDPEYEG